MRDHNKCSTSEVELHTCDLLIIRDVLLMFLKGETLAKDVSKASRASVVALTHETLDKVKESLSNNEGFVSIVAKMLGKQEDEWAEFIG